MRRSLSLPGLVLFLAVASLASAAEPTHEYFTASVCSPPGSTISHSGSKMTDEDQQKTQT